MINRCSKQFWRDSIEEYSESKFFLQRYSCLPNILIFSHFIVRRACRVASSILHVPVVVNMNHEREECRRDRLFQQL